MKIKSLLLLFSLFLNFSSTASIGKEELITAIKGRYLLHTDEVGEIHFLIRSNGKLEVLESAWYNSNETNYSYPSKLSIKRGDNGLFRGMPIAHLIFSEGSDESAIDFHLILTAEQGWDQRSPSLRLLSSFALENDGPNQVASILSKKLVLFKYNLREKKYSLVK